MLSQIIIRGVSYWWSYLLLNVQIKALCAHSRLLCFMWKMVPKKKLKIQWQKVSRGIFFSFRLGMFFSFRLEMFFSYRTRLFSLSISMNEKGISNKQQPQSCLRLPQKEKSEQNTCAIIRFRQKNTRGKAVTMWAIMFSFSVLLILFGIIQAFKDFGIQHSNQM